MPLPPYIHETLQDPERYQTVYARIVGSAAAPTAGLHFTPHLLDELRGQGVRVGFVTLHVGLDTFRPVEVEDFREHKMHSEEIDLDEATAELINETRRLGRARLRGWHDGGARAGERGGFEQWTNSSLFGRDTPVYHAWLSFPGGGCHDNQLPPAALHAAVTGERVCKQEPDRKSVSGGDTRTIQVF